MHDLFIFPMTCSFLFVLLPGRLCKKKKLNRTGCYWYILSVNLCPHLLYINAATSSHFITGPSSSLLHFSRQTMHVKNFYANQRSLFKVYRRCVFTVSTWIMAHRQDAAHWTRWPAPGRVSSCRPTSCTARGGSRFCTAPTVTMTSRQSPCRETPPSLATCKWKC